MKKLLPLMIFAALVSAACVMSSGPHGTRVAVVPVLPVVVELEAPYYFYGGYYYYYSSNRWFYSHSQGGPWTDLPRDHYPKELRFKGDKWGPGGRPVQDPHKGYYDKGQEYKKGQGREMEQERYRVQEVEKDVEKGRGHDKGRDQERGRGQGKGHDKD
jgi:hypothetical protein